MFMASVVAMELFSGARSRKSYQVISETIGAFRRQQRIIVPSLDEFEKAGVVLADLGWPASKKSNDALIAVCARKIGAEIWTCDYSDFAPVGRALQLPLRSID
jgi:predicted nucleic acid-binding protein